MPHAGRGNSMSKIGNMLYYYICSFRRNERGYVKT